jgi:hypothetical protein
MAASAIIADVTIFFIVSPRCLSVSPSPLSEPLATDRLNTPNFGKQKPSRSARAEFIALRMKRRKATAPTVFRQLQTY